MYILISLDFYVNRGVVAVTMRLLELDINQCPDKFYVPNAFKDTHKCDKRTSYVSSTVFIVSFPCRYLYE
jgi:hypothetical protein